MPATSLRRIWLCADDYGLSQGVNAAIRDLLERGRINATSVMTVTPAFTREEAASLAAIKANSPAVAIGLHVTLTAPFRSVTATAAFQPVGATLRTALMRQLDPESLAREVRAQILAFQDMFGTEPDFVDGHQHVQLFPQIREAVVTAVSETLPQAWVRQCGRLSPLTARLADRKGLLLDLLSNGFRKTATRRGIGFNPGFAGSYDFNAGAEYSELFPRFLRNIPEQGLIMCHPGFVDDMLKRLDPLTDLREREHAYFAGEAFPQILASHGITL
jgi:predicted glycoside hydrolase/deacetylase ChbG (UPF0249 family)